MSISNGYHTAFLFQTKFGLHIARKRELLSKFARTHYAHAVRIFVIRNFCFVCLNSAPPACSSWGTWDIAAVWNAIVVDNALFRLRVLRVRIPLDVARLLRLFRCLLVYLSTSVPTYFSTSSPSHVYASFLSLSFLTVFVTLWWLPRSFHVFLNSWSSFVGSRSSILAHLLPLQLSSLPPTFIYIKKHEMEIW